MNELVSCIAEVGAQSIPSKHDRARFEEHLSRVIEALGAELVPVLHGGPQ